MDFTFVGASILKVSEISSKKDTRFLGTTRTAKSTVAGRYRFVVL
jgi:hypothetical protein